jgi:hypothetical protein
VKFTRTKKQIEIMTLIVTAAARGEEMTVALLKTNLSYGATVSDQAITGSLKILERHGYLKTQLVGPYPMKIMPTAAAFRRFIPLVRPEPF